MKSLLSEVKKAESEKRAIAHFNIATLEQLKAIADVLRRLGVPAIVGVSDKEREFIGTRQVVSLVESYREEGVLLYLNADHTRTLGGVEETARFGFDSIIYDPLNDSETGKPSLEELIRKTKEAAKITKKNSTWKHRVLLEGELGYIGTSSRLLDEVPEGAVLNENSFTKHEEAKEFIKKTGVDLLAPAVGNIHGMLKNAKNPRLAIKRIKEIKNAVKIPLVLHGGSGVSDEDFRAAIEVGISVIHISTELRLAWRRGLEESFKENDELAPYKLLARSINNLEVVVEKRMRLFAGI